MAVNEVSYGPPRGSLTNKGIRRSLQANLVPAVITHCQVIAVRCVFELATPDEAKKQLAARRRQLEKKAMEQSDVSYNL